MASGSNPFDAELVRLANRDLDAEEVERTFKEVQAFLSNQELKASASLSLLTNVQYWIEKTRNAESPTVLIAILSSLRSLLSIAESRDKFLKQNGLETLMEFAKHDDEGVRVACLLVLKELTTAPDTLSTVLTSDVVRLLLESLFDPAIEVACASTASLAVILSERPHEASIDDLVRLIALLEEVDKQTLPRTLEKIIDIFRTIWNVSNAVNAKDKMIQAGAVDCVAQFLGSEEPQVQRHAVGVIMSLAVSLKGKEAAIANELTIPSLCSIVADEKFHSWTRRNASMALLLLSENATALEMIAQNLLEMPGMFRELVGARKVAQAVAPFLQDPKDDIIDPTVQCLSALAADDEGCEALWDCFNIVPSLCKVLVQGRASSAWKTTKCLQLFCIRHDNALQEFKCAVDVSAELKERVRARPTLFELLNEKHSLAAT